tara:strand:- start:7964 stop:8647 length:684 start_codon:yes stop_codon:yes gene_type:complete
MAFFRRKENTHAPFKSDSFKISYHRKGYTIKGPVPHEYVLAAKGVHEPNFWQPIIAEWKSKPAYYRKNTLNLHKLIERRYKKTYEPQTVFVAPTAPTAPVGQRKVAKPGKPQKKQEQRRPKIPETKRKPLKELDTGFVPVSEKLSGKMKEKKQDIYGEKWAMDPDKAAKQLNLSKEQQDLFMNVITLRKDIQDIPGHWVGRYDRFRHRVQGAAPAFESKPEGKVQLI